MQEPEYDTYIKHLDGNRFSFFLNVALISEVPINGYPFLTTVSVNLRAPDHLGFAGDTDNEILGSLDEEISQFSGGDAIFAGRKMGDGKSEYYFYSKAEDGLKIPVASAMEDKCDYSFAVTSRLDVNWDYYSEFIFPDTREQCEARNNKVRVALVAEGDNLKSSRSTDHFVYFKCKVSAAKFGAKAQTMGFECEQGSKGLFRRSYVVKLVHDAIPIEIDESTFAIGELARDHDGIYDGWETFVIRP